MQTLGVGILGFGFIGKVHACAYRDIPLYYDPPPARVRLVGVATSREETARKAVEQGGFEIGTTDWRELIARDDIQVINICSPNRAHADQVVAALEAGKHVYCDKPLVVTDEDAARVEAALAGYGGVGQMTLQYRFYPSTLRARQLIEEGFLGQVLSFRAAYLHSGSVDPDRPVGWKQLGSEQAGVLQDLGTHLVDLMDHLIGPFHSALAETRTLYPERPTRDGGRVRVETDDQVLMLLRLPNGAVGTLEASKIATGAEDDLLFEINGDRGALRFSLMNPSYLEAYDLREPESPLGGQRGGRRIATVQRYEKPGGGFPSPKAGIGWMRGHTHCLWHFLQGVANGRPVEPSLRRGLHLQRLLAALARSAAERRWVDLPQPDA